MDSVEADDWIDELISTDVSVECTTEDCIDSYSSCSVDALSDGELVVREDECMDEEIDGKCDGQCKCARKIPGLEVKKVDDSPVNGFTCYTHTLPNGNTFTLDGELQDGGTIIEVNGTGGPRKPIEGVKEVSVLYWSKNDNTPLLLGVKYGSGSTSAYYARSSDCKDWVYHGPLQGNDLETQLDYQNCQHNSAVTIDLSKGLSNSQTKYCCSGNHSGGSRVQRSNRVTVTPHEVCCRETGHTSTPISYFKHEISSVGDLKLAKIKYNGRDRKNIKGPELNFPIKGPVSVYVFHCNNNPVLIHVKYGTSGGSDVTGWYKQRPSSDVWERVLDNISSITPSNFGNLTCKNGFNALVDELKGFDGCKTLGTCPATPTADPESKPEEGQHEALTDGGASIFAILTGAGMYGGPLAGSAATFFGGWKLYNRYKGDPWVRHGYPIEFLKNVPY
ncbi:hypothetical protein BEWA_041690 [Theileria equi strain WA]|uniref:Uncharacterized protein n=1 Tax=Theileria equi strain WA TaxID=1537102 RepID=L1LFJ9_THEEQ|nr:hypothetical protein BEWA_041690 [Theileria equi strain WA]EKX74131.1 hypothetical protein BEWA_041690 [Theileria equi strain WA]|eukprot:XP_004833583.1 hypothetical protein BEWA_041690 [Theileria equi strain WA]